MEQGKKNRRTVWASGVHQVLAENRRELGLGLRGALRVLREHKIPCRAAKGGTKIDGFVLIEVPKEFAQPAERLVMYQCGIENDPWDLGWRLRSSPGIVMTPLEGPGMVKARNDPERISIYDVMNALRSQGIAFRIPRPPRNRDGLMVDRRFLRNSELIELLAQNKLNRDGIQELAKGKKEHSQRLAQISDGPIC